MGTSIREGHRSSLDLTLPLRNLGWLLALGTIVFTLAGAGIVLLKMYYQFDRVYGLYDLLDLDTDSSIPTWFSSLGLLSCSVLLWFHSAIDKALDTGRKWQWRLLALIFLFLSVDEVARIHEVVGTLVGSKLAPDVTQQTHGLVSYHWLVAYVGFAAVLAVIYLPFLYRLPRRVAGGCILAGVVYVGGAGATESFNGHIVHATSQRDPVYMWGTVCEEFLEMCGMTLFAHVLVRYLGERVRAVSLRGVLTANG